MVWIIGRAESLGRSGPSEATDDVCALPSEMIDDDRPELWISESSEMLAWRVDESGRRFVTLYVHGFEIDLLGAVIHIRASFATGHGQGASYVEGTRTTSP